MINDYFSIAPTYLFMINQFGKTIEYKHGTTFLGIVQEIDDKLQSIDSKYLLTVEDLKQGTEISCDDVNYLVMTRNEKVNGVYYKYTIQKCPYDINFVAGGVLQRIPSIIQTKTIDIQTNQSIILPEGKIIITISRNNTTNKIAVNDRFIAMGSAWKISGLDKSCEGIIKVNADIDQIMTGDDIINEIPNNTQKPSYSFTVNPASVSIKKGQTQQLTVVVSENGTQIENPTLIYKSNNDNIVTISDTGMITGIGEGSCNIKISYIGDYNTASTSINIEVAPAEAEHNYVLSVSPESINIDNGKTQQITAIVSDKGTAISLPTFIYSSDNTSVATVSNTGLVSGISVGSANIIVNYIGLDNKTYSKTIPVTITAQLVKTIGITLNSTDTTLNPNKIKINHTQNYIISETDSNGNVINDTFTVTGSGCDPSYYSLTITDGNNFSINNLKGTGSQYLTVTATSKTNPSISGTIKINLAARW
ncbi:Ig-like domain-containing protein [Clostridium coskatii]|uniref:Bacterial Ig-like domain (Group 2) n=1 Tax=Clostridium coskatii TaxID=1705578 RepID=A0A162L8I3_9CLOT|nr:Ig-like domain-containing protein [Clostridium coskatii]OAA90136.1 Bacterial Ig-like domain (group 2) [Clostridium coskatii]OBR97429.1 bacterial Ig-like domain (group 2) [Clostridium coskatii]